MQLLGVWSVSWVLGAGLFMGAVAVLVGRWLQQKVPPATCRRELSALVIEFGKQNVRIVAVAVVGGLFAMVSVGIGDHIANRPCVSACEAAGWNRGVLRRANPHEPTALSTRAQCWCSRGDAWSTRPIRDESPTAN